MGTVASRLRLAPIVVAAAACSSPADGEPTTAASASTPEDAASPSASAASPVATDAPPVTAPVRASHPAGPWTALAPAPVALTEVAAAPFDGRVWVAGGLDATGRPTDVVARYDPASGTWDGGPSLPVAVHHAALVATDDALFVIGGFTAPYGPGDLAATDAVWRLDAPDGAWEAGPPLPDARGAGAATWDGNRLVFGGGVGPTGVAGEVWALEDGAWRGIGSLSVARQHLAATSDESGTAWFLGGRVVSLAENLGTVDEVDGLGVRTLDVTIDPRSGLGAFWSPSGACAAGGETPNGTVGTVQCVDDAGALVGLPPLGVPRHGVGTAVLDGVAYAMLGGREPGLYVSDVAEALILGP